MCIIALPAHIFVYHVDVWCPQMPEKCNGSHGIGIRECL